MVARLVAIAVLTIAIALPQASLAGPKKHKARRHSKAAERVELRRSLPKWVHQTDRDGSLSDPEHLARNQQKNRLYTTNAPTSSWSFDEFITNVEGYDQTLGLTGKTRHAFQGNNAVLSEIKTRENQLVSVTGYLNLAYAGGPESTNYDDKRHHDWHLELFNAPYGHAPQAGDETPIICEVTRFTETKLYKDGERLQPLLAFTRTGGNGSIVYKATGHRAHKVRITGYLLWDDEHNKTSGPGIDIGATVQTVKPKGFHNPWRRTPWEIHPIVRIEDLGP